MANFGWELLGAPQEINYTTTHRTQETDRYYSSEYTSKTHYVKITFQRDNNMPNYEELVRLEIECNNLDLIYPKIPIKPSYGTGWIIFTVIGLLLGGVIGIFIFIPRMVYVSKKQKIWTQEYEDTMKNRIEIENKQKSISERAKILLK
jgi:hypothetical protein